MNKIFSILLYLIIVLSFNACCPKEKEIPAFSMNDFKTAVRKGFDNSTFKPLLKFYRDSGLFVYIQTTNFNIKDTISLHGGITYINASREIPGTTLVPYRFFVDVSRPVNEEIKITIINDEPLNSFLTKYSCILHYQLINSKWQFTKEEVNIDD